MAPRDETIGAELSRHFPLTPIEELVKWCREERQKAQELLELMVSRRVRCQSRSNWMGWGDTTADEIVKCRERIAKMDDLLACHPEFGG